MRVLLTGASGTVGKEVLRQLAGLDDVELTVYDKKSSQAVKTFSPYTEKVNICYGDLQDKEETDRVCRDKDVAVHLAAIIPPLADLNPEHAHNVNVVGTKNLISSLKNHSKDAFILYASSVSVYGDRLDNPMIMVGDPLQPSEGDEYAKTKIEAENIIMESGLDWSIFRLTAIMGTDNHKASELMFHMPLPTLLEIASPEDTGRAFVKAIRKTGELSGRIFNLGGGEGCRITYREFLSEAYRIFGLGELDYPEKAFAEKNFHCGYYADGHHLEEILEFRKDSMETYFDNLRNSVSSIQKIITGLIKKKVKSKLLNKSEPFKAFNENNEELIQRFFRVA
jgi:nucleoside-diphosphate-sugar epimerase